MRQRKGGFPGLPSFSRWNDESGGIGNEMQKKQFPKCNK